MKIETISFKNIFAYGEELQTVNYTDNGELILLKGKSGAGKSAILSLPCVLLYGRIEKTKNAIANRINRNGYIRGTVKAGSHTYTIERGFLPNYLKVYKDGTDIENIGIRDAQAYIDSEIIEIPMMTFNNMISISMKKFKSFLTMSPADRKQIIDRVFDLELVNILYETVNTDIRETGNLINNDNTALFQLQQTLGHAQNEFNSLQSRLNTEEYKSKIEANNASIRALNEQIEAYKTTYAEWSRVSVEKNQQLTTLRQSRMTNDSNIAQLRDKISLFMQERCPTCGTPFNTENIQNVKKKLEELLKQQETIKEQVAANEKAIIDSMATYQTECSKITQAINECQRQTYELSMENTKIDASLKANAEYQSITNIIKQTEEQIQILQQSITEKSIKMGRLSKLREIYSVSGVKQHIINNYLPVLNKEIDQNLELLNFPYKVEFDSKFDSHIMEMGIKVPVETLSDGEMTRVDLVVLCALFKLLKCRYPSVNILSIDELISFLDVENSQDLLRFLKEFADEMKLNIFVVSHVNIDTEYFDRCIEVSRGPVGFSVIKEENLMQ